MRRATRLFALALIAVLAIAGASRDQGADRSAAETCAHHAASLDHGAHGAHMKFTATRPRTAADEQRASELVAQLRNTLKRYQDYRLAITDGYKPFLPNVPLHEYHFTNYRHAFLEAFRFDPERPTSLLYRKVPGGYELSGVMFTVPKRAGEEEMNERVPLSIARWHAHVNICLPRGRERRAADWTRFGPRGSIRTEEACDEASGRFVPQLFGWMVHVYPFEKEAEKIWTHRM